MAPGSAPAAPPEAGQAASRESRAPRVHVVVPAFNAAWSIGDTLASVAAQGLRNLAVTIVDDGSSEDLSAATGPVLERDPRFRLVRQENAGLAAARNRGLSEARSPFVAFIDSDDLWHPDFLLRLVAALEAAPGAPFAYAHSHRIDEENRLVPTPRWPYEPRHDLRGLLTLNTVASGSASVFRTDAVRAAGGFDTSLRARGAEGAEDWKLSLRLAATAEPVLVPDVLAAYRLTPSSMSRGNPARQLRAVRAVMDDLRAERPDLPAQAFRDARTALNGWLFEAFLRNGERGTAAALLAESYLLNPLWLLSRELRTIHAMKLSTLLADRGERPRLADLREPGGRRPFAFLG